MQDISPQAGPLSIELYTKGITTLNALKDWLTHLPYSRNTNRADYTLILPECRGTCSTKHAFAKAVANENDWTELNLHLGFFRMNALNTPRVATVLAKHSLSEIPEAHTYLRIAGSFTDLTGIHSSISEVDISDEKEIQPDDIGGFKEQIHRDYLQQWIEENHLRLSLEVIWKIRAQCIASLAQ